MVLLRRPKPGAPEEEELVGVPGGSPCMPADSVLAAAVLAAEDGAPVLASQAEANAGERAALRLQPGDVVVGHALVDADGCSLGVLIAVGRDESYRGLQLLGTLGSLEP